MRFKTALVTLLAAAVAGLACAPDLPETAARAESPPPGGSALGVTFGDYWYGGEAELTSYELEQARYGEVHRGHAVLIYVTEDFSREKQVKLDNPGAAGEDAVKVLKLNLTKKFHTGIYPYSMMSSVFTPVARPFHTLKLTTSSQEWCGHTFTQLNRFDRGYRFEQRSYFESEGDADGEIEGALAEDELWNLIRLDPEALPIGDVQLIPGTMYLRLRHGVWQGENAVTELRSVEGAEGLADYVIDYPDLERTLAIRFHRDFPHEIEGWQESYSSGWGSGRKRLTTRAFKKERMMLDYWRRNRVADEVLQQELGIAG